MLSVTGLLFPFAVDSVTDDDPPAFTGSLNATVTVSPFSALPTVPPALFAEPIAIGTGDARGVRRIERLVERHGDHVHLAIAIGVEHRHRCQRRWSPIDREHRAGEAAVV